MLRTRLHILPLLLILLPGTASAMGSQDTLAVASDSLATPPDSVTHYSLPAFSGSIRLLPSLASVLTGDSLRWIAGRWTGEALAFTGALQSFDPSSEGGYAQFFSRGLDQRGIGFFWNGRPMDDPGSGVLNPYHLQMEDCALLEVVTGPRAFLHGLDHPGAAVNFVSREWNANKPYTRILYAEGGDDYAYSDGTFAQNISRRVGVNAGFQHIGVQGGFTNSSHEQWNVRGSFRIHLSRTWFATVSEHYTTTNTGLNGGVDMLKTRPVDTFNPRSAIVVNSDSYEKLDRHDIDLSIVGLDAEDSSVTTRVTLFHTALFREYRDEENRNLANGITISSDHRTRRSGIEGTRVFTLGALRLEGGAGVENLRSVASPNLGSHSTLRPSIRGVADYALSSAFRVGLFGRIERFFGETGTGVGGDCSFTLDSTLKLFAGVSRVERLPGMWEQFWSDSTVIRPGTISPEHQVLLEAGVETKAVPHTSLRLVLFRRSVENPVEIRATAGGSPFGTLSIANGGRLVCTGIEASLAFRLWVILMEGSGTFQSSTRDGAASIRFPRVSLSGGIYLRGAFFDGHLDLRAGVRGRYVSSAEASRFNPEALAWGGTSVGGLGAWSSADAVVAARIGATHLHLVWENLTDVNAFTASYSPLRGRGIRFGLAWEFLN